METVILVGSKYNLTKDEIITRSNNETKLGY